MNIDEAIKHARKTAEYSTGSCAHEHLQRAEWLEELKQTRKDNKNLRDTIASMERELAGYAYYGSIGL